MLKAQKNLLKSFSIKPDKKDSWGSIPVSGKDKIREAKVPKIFTEVRSTSGSTGESLYVFYSEKAVDFFIKRAVTSLKKSDVSKKDVVMNLFSYGHYIPGSMYERACHTEGISVVPFGAPNTCQKEKAIEAILKIKPTVWLGIPSYVITLLDLLAKEKRQDFFPRKILVAGEMMLDAYIEKFKEHGVEVANHFGLTECPAIGVSVKGNLKKIQVIGDGIYAESIEESGVHHLVVTDLYNYATPIIRYKTGDVIDSILQNKDGSISQFSIIGRSDDLIKIQGVLVSKTKIVEKMLMFTDTFVVHIITKDSRDFVEVHIDAECKKKENEIAEALAFLKKKKLVFKEQLLVPTTSSLKKKHVVDLRK